MFARSSHAGILPQTIVIVNAGNASRTGASFSGQAIYVLNKFAACPIMDMELSGE